MFPTVGALVASRRPRNPIGWIFLSVGLAVFGLFAEQYGSYAIVTRPGALPGGLLMTWISTWTSSMGLLIMLSFTFLLFPTGHLPSRRWRPVALAAGVLIALYSIMLAIAPGPLLQGVAASNNPLGLTQAAGTVEVLQQLALVMFIFVIAMSAASLIERFLNARGEERQQLKWIVYASSLELGVFACIGILQWFLRIRENMVEYKDLAGAVAPFAGIAIAAFPHAVGIAILRHHLFNIDLIISRTLVYVPLTAILAGMYAASISLLQKLFVALTGEGSDATIVLTTLALTASFTPIKNWLQAIVDRRFKEAPNPTRKLGALREELRSNMALLDPRLVVRHLLDDAMEAYGAVTGAVYLRQGGRMELVHTRGEWHEGAEEISVPLKSGGQELGTMKLGARKHGAPYSEQDRKTLQQAADVVAQAIG
jgi:hypothetical protein